MIEAITKRLSAISAGLLVLSVTYDFAFLHSLDLSFALVPTTIADHVRSAIIWAPPLVLVSGAGFLTGLSSRLPASGELVPRTKTTKLADLVAFGLCLPGLLLLALVSEPGFALVALTTAVGLPLLRFQPGGANIDARLGAGAARIVFAVPIVLAIVGGAGYVHGSGMRTAKASIALVVKEGTGESEIAVRALRRFSTVAIVVLADGRVQIFPTEMLVRSTQKLGPNPSLLCRANIIECPRST